MEDGAEEIDMVINIGATPEHVALMRKTVGPKMGVKAAGGVRTFEDAVTMINAGATRLGTSGGVKIEKIKDLILLNVDNRKTIFHI